MDSEFCSALKRQIKLGHVLKWRWWDPYPGSPQRWWHLIHLPGWESPVFQWDGWARSVGARGTWPAGQTECGGCWVEPDTPRQAGRPHREPPQPSPPPKPAPNLSSALQGCLWSFSGQGVNQPIARLQMSAVKETSHAPEKGPVNEMQAPFGWFLYTKKLTVWISFLFSFSKHGKTLQSPFTFMWSKRETQNLQTVCKTKNGFPQCLNQFKFQKYYSC